MRELDKIAESLFDKIRTRFENVNLGDEKAKRTIDPTKARFFNFDYIDRNGKNYGNVTMNIVDDSSLKVYFSKNITDELSDEEQTDWFEFLRDIRRFSRANFLTFDARDINKSNLDIRDIKQQSKASGTFKAHEVDTGSVTESRMWGTSRSSYQECGPARIIVRHSTNVDEEKRGSRTRNIESMFIENHMGERRLLPFKNLHGARAMARHVSEGGSIDDELGCGISEMVKEMTSMVHFVREAKRRQFEDAETDQMAKAAVKRYGEIKDKLKHLGGRRGYSSYKMEYSPANDIEEDVDVDALRERFVRKVYDDRFNDALPYVYRAYKQYQESVATPMGEEFESWANEIAEDAFETDDEKFGDLAKLMEKPISVGQDGVDAFYAISNIFDSEDLESKLTDLSRSQGPDADARTTILAWMRENNMNYIADQLQNTLDQQNANPEPLPTSEEPPVQKLGNTTTDEVPTNESRDDLGLIKWLAGLKK